MTPLRHRFDLPGTWRLALTGLCALALFVPAARAAGTPAPTASSAAAAPSAPAETPKAVPPAPAGAEAALARLDRLEELLWRLTPDVDQLDTSIQNLELPDG